MANLPVSPGNPCPMLRALVVRGYVPDRGTSIKKLVETLGTARGGDAETNRSFRKKVKLVAMAANGLWPWDLIHNAVSGVRLHKLRDGPLDKHGVGSGILDSQARIALEELSRLEAFGSPKTGASGASEIGLSAVEINAMMDANFERAAGKRRKIDRKLMDGEWPVLLEILGKQSSQGLYLSVDEVRTLFIDRKLPERIESRLS